MAKRKTAKKQEEENQRPRKEKIDKPPAQPRKAQGGRDADGDGVPNKRDADFQPRKGRVPASSEERIPKAALIDSVTLPEAERVAGEDIGEVERVTGESLDPAAQAEFRQKQLGLANQLEAQTRGEGPSLAQLQLQDASQRNVQQAFGLAAARQGGNPALALRSAMNAQAQVGGQAALQSAQLRLAEQLQAQQALAELTGQGRGQDIDVATKNAALAQQANLANQKYGNQANLAQAGLNQQANLANQAAANAQALNQGTFQQNARTLNQAAINNAILEQARIKAGIRQSQIGAGATTGAASIAAQGALQRLREELGVQEDPNSQYNRRFYDQLENELARAEAQGGSDLGGIGSVVAGVGDLVENLGIKF